MTASQKTSFAAAGALLVLDLAACGAVSSGNIVSAVRDVAGFDSIE